MGKGTKMQVRFTHSTPQTKIRIPTPHGEKSHTYTAIPNRAHTTKTTRRPTLKNPAEISKKSSNNLKEVKKRNRRGMRIRRNKIIK